MLLVRGVERSGSGGNPTRRETLKEEARLFINWPNYAYDTAGGNIQGNWLVHMSLNNFNFLSRRLHWANLLKIQSLRRPEATKTSHASRFVTGSRKTIKNALILPFSKLVISRNLKIVLFTALIVFGFQPAFASSEILAELKLTCSKDKSGKKGYSDDYRALVTEKGFSATQWQPQPENEKGGFISSFSGEIYKDKVIVEGYGTRELGKSKWKYQFKGPAKNTMLASLASGLDGYENKGNKQERKCTLRLTREIAPLSQVLLIGSFKTQLNSLRDTERALKDEVRLLKKQIDSSMASAQELEQSIASLTQELDTEKQENGQLQSDIETANNAKADLNSRLKYLTEEFESQKASAEQALAELAEAKMQPEIVVELNSKVKELSDNIANQSAEINSLKNDRDELKTKLASAESALADRSKALTALQEDLEVKSDLERKIKELETELADSAVGSKQLGALATTISELKESLAAKDADLEQKATSLTSAQGQIDELVSSLSALELLNKETAQKYEEAQTDLEALTELARKMRAEISEQKLENEKLLAAASAPTCQTEKRQINYLKSKVEVCEKTLLGESIDETKADADTITSEQVETSANANSAASTTETASDNAPMLRLTPSGEIDGQLIHQSKSTKFYKCENVVNPTLIKFGYDWLRAMSDSFKVPKPSSDACVVSKGGLFNTISVRYFVSEKNSRCFYANYCDDTRDMSFTFKNGQVYLNFMVINADTKLTKQQCVNLDGEMVNSKGCNKL